MRALTPAEFRELDYESRGRVVDPDAVLSLIRRGCMVSTGVREGKRWFARTDLGMLAVRVHKAAVAAGAVLW